MTSGRGSGRPPVPADHQRTESISVKLTLLQRRMLESLALEFGEHFTDVLRGALYEFARTQGRRRSRQKCQARTTGVERHPGEASRRGPGRPRLPDGAALDEKGTLTLCPDDLRHARRLEERLGIDLPTMVRRGLVALYQKSSVGRLGLPILWGGRLLVATSQHRILERGAFLAIPHHGVRCGPRGSHGAK